jgi:phasin family protein
VHYKWIIPRQIRGIKLSRERYTMVKNFEDLQQVSKENMEVTMKSAESLSKGAQAIATEVADYSKKAFEDGSAMLEKLFGVKSLEKAIELQTEYAKTSYEGFVAKATKISEMYAGLAKESYKPFETMMAKAKA